jgi:hypothetical protein
MRILTDSEVIDLTGHKQPQAQRKWLDAQGIRHWVNAANKVRIWSTALDNAVQTGAKSSKPDFSKLNTVGIKA